MAEEYGKIRKSLLTAIADAIRAKKDTTAFFTPEQMAVEIESIVTGDTPVSSQMFMSSASGTLPNVTRAMAASQYTLTFESSAIGTLQEA